MNTMNYTSAPTPTLTAPAMIQLSTGNDALEVPLTDTRSSGEVVWQKEQLSWHVEPDLDHPGQYLFTIESKLLPHGWTSRTVAPGSSYEIEHILREWPRRGHL